MRSASAFTLMELVATIVVLATLSSVAMPRFYDLDAEAKKAADEASIGALKEAMAGISSASFAQCRQ